MLWVIFVSKMAEVTGVWSSLHMNRFINCHIRQMNETKEDHPHIKWVFLEMKRPGFEADPWYLVPSLPHIHLWLTYCLTFFFTATAQTCLWVRTFLHWIWNISEFLRKSRVLISYVWIFVHNCHSCLEGRKFYKGRKRLENEWFSCHA